MTKCYRVVKEILSPHKHDTKTSLECQLCGGHIKSNTYPKSDVICVECGDSLMRGEFRGLAHAPSQKVYQATCDKLAYYMNKAGRLEERLNTIHELYETLDDDENVARVARYVDAMTDIMSIAELGAIENENNEENQYETILAIASDTLSDIDSISEE